MIGFEIKLDQGQRDDGEPIWDDLTSHEDYVLAVGDWRLATLRGGTGSGRASVMLRLELPDGTTVIAQTSARAFMAAAKAIEGAHGPDGDR